MAHPLRTLLADDVGRILDHFAGCFGIRIAFFSAEGEELLSGFRMPICAYCREIRRTRAGRDACQADDEHYRAQAAQRRDLVAYTCHGGLQEAVQPVFIDDRMAGFVMVGQFRQGDEPPAEVRSASPSRRDRLAREFARVPVIPTERVPHVLGLLTALVGAIANGRLVRVAGDVLVGRAVAYIEANVHRPITLAEVARHVHRSPSSVSHQFTKVLGRSFRQTVVDTKLRLAERLLRDRPDWTVRQVAYAVGYDDPYHFSRLFRKHRGLPPSRAR